MNNALLYLLPLIIILSLGIIIYYMFRSTLKIKDDNNNVLKDQILLLKEELAQERNIVNDSKEEIKEMEKELSTITANFGNLRERYEEMILSDRDKMEKFEILAQKVIAEKTKKFDEDHKKGIKEILEPLKERIHHFEQKVEHNNKETISRHTALYTQINHLKDLNNKITQETTNLTKALKGDNKTQGSWGEIILESILNKSGLQKGREYTTQDTFKNEEGKMIRPDVVIHLPDNKKLVIDSKVSLKAYDAFMSTENKEEQQSALSALTLSIRTHVDGLSNKKYHEIYEIESPDFVLMFVPIDSAFAAALHKSPNLYNYAFDKNVVIVTSSTLLATLKTVDSMWRNEKQQKYALEIAKEAGKMYDKFTNLVDDLIKVGKQIDSSKSLYEASMKKLTTGKGNLVSRAEKMKALGAKANKSINKNIIDRLEE